MDRPETLTIAPAEWSDLAGEQLAPAMPSDLYGVDGLRRDVMEYRAQLWSVHAGGAIVGHFVTRFDQLPGGSEIVIVAAGGRLTGIDLTRSVLPYIEQMGRAAGCRSARVHTFRPGLCAKLAAMGWRNTHAVFRRRLA